MICRVCDICNAHMSPWTGHARAPYAAARAMTSKMTSFSTRRPSGGGWSTAAEHSQVCGRRACAAFVREKFTFIHLKVSRSTRSQRHACARARDAGGAAREGPGDILIRGEPDLTHI